MRGENAQKITVRLYHRLVMAVEEFVRVTAAEAKRPPLEVVDTGHVLGGDQVDDNEYNSVIVHFFVSTWNRT